MCLIVKQSNNLHLDILQMLYLDLDLDLDLHEHK